MNHLAASVCGAAAMSALLVVALSRPAPPALAIVKADRLDIKVADPAHPRATGDSGSDQVKQGSLVNEGDSHQRPDSHLPPKVVVTERVVPAIISPATNEAPKIIAPPESHLRSGDATPASDALRGRVAVVPAGVTSHADSVCGPRGRTWYTRENGWRYWRCVR